jgi:hypothetical protein
VEEPVFVPPFLGHTDGKPMKCKLAQTNLSHGASLGAVSPSYFPCSTFWITFKLQERSPNSSPNQSWKNNKANKNNNKQPQVL